MCASTHFFRSSSSFSLAAMPMMMSANSSFVAFTYHMKEVIISMIISVMAGVISYYICKWFDRE